VRFELDDPISLAELKAALEDAKPGKATSNHMPVELLEALSENMELLGLLHRLVSDVFKAVFEDGRASPPPSPQPKPSPPGPLPVLPEPAPCSQELIA